VGAERREARGQVTLLDTLRKRTDFVTEASRRSGLTNTTALWARAEDAAQMLDHRQVRVGHSESALGGVWSHGWGTAALAMRLGGCGSDTHQ
jgi:hypothetical protein